MMLWPMVFGALAGTAVIGSLSYINALNERSGIAVLLAAIAFFWPVFAVQADASAGAIVLHSVVFLGFAALAAVGFRRSATLIAIGIIGHGILDAIFLFAGHPGPVWWPAFCGMLDLVAGALLIFLIRTQRIQD